MRLVKWTLTHQQPSGMIGSVHNDDWWPRMVMTKALAQQYNATGDARLLIALTRYFRYHSALCPVGHLRIGASIVGRIRHVVEWLHEHTGEAFLLD